MTVSEFPVAVIISEIAYFQFCDLAVSLGILPKAAQRVGGIDIEGLHTA